MKAKVDKNACIGCGACTYTCPNVFELDEEGFAKVKVEEINEEDKGSATEARDNCPTSAISIEE